MEGASLFLTLLCIEAAVVASSPTGSLDLWRGASCSSVGARGCSADCQYVSVCSNAGRWVDIQMCSDDNLCVDGECVPSKNHVCGSTDSVLCGDHLDGVAFPDLEDCSSFYQCRGPLESPLKKSCARGYFDPCSGLCSMNSPVQCKYYKPCTVVGIDGYEASIQGNPSLYYTCVGSVTLFKKCLQGYYNEGEGECLGVGSVCGSLC